MGIKEMRTAQDLLTELNAADESPRIEAKRSREVGKSITELLDGQNENHEKQEK